MHGVGETMLRKMRKEVSQSAKVKNPLYISIIWAKLAKPNARLAEVSSALVTAQQTAAAAQALHAGTMHQQLLSGKSGADQPERETEPVQKRSWFSRFFGD